MYLVSCTNVHCDVTDSVKHGMVKNTETSWNIIFLRNKKFLICASNDLVPIVCYFLSNFYFSLNDNPYYEKCFLFYLKSSFCS